MIKKSSIYILMLLIGLYSCSTDEGEDPVAPKEKTEFELSSKIIGKWDVENPSENVQAGFTKQSATSGCYIFSLVFRADKTFRINSRQGIIEGTYEVESEEKIILNNQGSLGEIKFNSGGISFSISLDSLCSRQLTCLHDPDYAPGNCSSFLECNDRKIWKLQEAQNSVFIEFFDHHDGTWYRKFAFTDAANCYSVESNQLETGTMVLVKNNIKELVFVYDSGETNDIYTYSLADNGNLHLMVEGDSGSTSQSFLPATQEELDTKLEKPECGAKTYVPDDSFEKFLTDSGYDHVMDDYVLSENIYFVEHVDIEDYYYRNLTDMTGLEDFKNLKFLQLIGSHSENLKMLNISGNSKLEGIYLEISSLEFIDLAQNPLLNFVFIQDAKIETFDFSNNPLLRTFEFNGGDLKSIDLSRNKNLENFQINDNPLESILLGENDKLTSVRIYGHSGQPGDFPEIPLKEIDVTQLPNLKLLHITNANIEAVDLSGNQELTDLVVFNTKLNSLDISGNDKIREFDASENGELSCIEVNEMQLDLISEFPLSWQKDESAGFSLDCEK